MHYHNLEGLRHGYISVKKVIRNKEMWLIFINLDSIFIDSIHLLTDPSSVKKGWNKARKRYCVH